MQTRRFEAQSFWGGWSYPLIASVLGVLLLVMPRFLAPEGSAILLALIGGSLILFAAVNLWGQLRRWWRLRPYIRRDRAISALYEELSLLLARPRTEPHLDEQIRQRFAELRRLQEEEADEIEKRFEAGLLLKPGEGYGALDRADEILARYEDPSSAHVATQQKD